MVETAPKKPQPKIGLEWWIMVIAMGIAAYLRTKR